ncbi:MULTISPECIES: hypothetical protein [Megasphaera]|uniref:Putative lipoprotein n=1 Tax=Megasphaera vaginalis (ex Srinivasan et al. 2021) TaxID=1111454 RepID=U7UME8_9FIRM|nr:MULTISPECIES: hypothetical protein [Megasphaera]ERT60510.1 putative lipoprotein [Megasphaera vaginalis (ex Srinivasan et al. 2021)]
MLDKAKEVHNALKKVCSGFVNSTSGGCCGLALPPEEQGKLRDLKQGKQSESAK